MWLDLVLESSFAFYVVGFCYRTLSFEHYFMWLDFVTERFFYRTLSFEHYFMWLDFVTERFLLNIILCGWILLQNAFF